MSSGIRSDGTYVSPRMVEEARNVDIVELITRLGYPLRKAGRGHQMIEHDSLYISNGKWMWNSRGYGGNSIHFVMHFPERGQRTFQEAVRVIAETMGFGHLDHQDRRRESVPVPRPREEARRPTPRASLEMPMPHRNDRRVIAYLTKQRCIEPSLVINLIKDGLIYEDDRYHNCVFPLYDSSGIAQGGALRGTLSFKVFKGIVPHSDMSYPWVFGNSDAIVCHVSEGSIDALSIATMMIMDEKDPLSEMHCSVNGNNVVAIRRLLCENPQIEKLICHYDRDKAGEIFLERAKIEFGGQVIIEHEAPKTKDPNLDLLQRLGKELG